MDRQNNKIITRLTALWAISESGLGGFMHALKIPFTGFFLGGFAIVIITLIGHYSTKKGRSILLATLLVMLIKAIGSPHSPPQAYLAVGFQGLSGALFYALLGTSPVSAGLFGMIALAESAVQKVIVMTLIFGKSIWMALDDFGNGIMEDFGLKSGMSLSWWLILTYTGIYVIWGLLVGIWSTSLPRSLDKRSAGILAELSLDTATVHPVPAVKPRNRKRKNNLFMILALVFVVLVFLWQGSVNTAVYVILRTFAALLLLYFVIDPVVKWMITKWLSTREDRNRAQIRNVMDAMPEIRNYITPAMALARRQHRGIAVYKAFVINWIVIALYHD